MDDATRNLIEQACVRLIVEYTHLVDHGEAARIADLFTDDGTCMSAHGRPAIRKFLQARQDNAGRMSRHVCTNTHVDVMDETSARGVTYLTLYRHDGEPGPRVAPLLGPTLLGEYRDSFELASDGWRFKRRELVIDFLAPGVKP